MSDDFQPMVEVAQPFFRELRDNNTKAWFEPRKATYQSEIRKPAEIFADLIASDLSKLTGRAMTPKLFRIHRDVRFSKDKSPYKPYQHMLWSCGEALTPAWFFAIEPDRLWLGMGVMGLSGDDLTRYRAFADAHGATFMAQLSALNAAHGTELSDRGLALKRVPKPYDQDHPQAELLKRKSLILGTSLPTNWRDKGLALTLTELAKAHLPIWTLQAEGF